MCLTSQICNSLDPFWKQCFALWIPNFMSEFRGDKMELAKQHENKGAGVRRMAKIWTGLLANLVADRGRRKPGPSSCEGHNSKYEKCYKAPLKNKMWQSQDFGGEGKNTLQIKQGLNAIKDWNPSRTVIRLGLQRRCWSLKMSNHPTLVELFLLAPCIRQPQQGPKAMLFLLATLKLFYFADGNEIKSERLIHMQKWKPEGGAGKSGDSRTLK